MDYQEALEIYKLGNYGSELSKAEADYWLANIDTATELAFKCLEKQIPMKPIKDERYRPMKCPFCHDFLEYYQNFCDNCGQRIDHNLER